jgi:hypothetical protein
VGLKRTVLHLLSGELIVENFVGIREALVDVAL